ncbi:MAG: ribulose-phosphate 3-epimerase [Coriobacteriia bacterium]
MSDRILMAPSILSADFTRLAEAVARVEEAGADLIHVDVMDGHFVPNLTIGPPVIKALKRVTKLPLDVHLMIDNADSSVGWYLDAGADIVIVHVEACNHLHRIVQTIREAGALPGISLNPGTSVSSIEGILPEVDVVLVMSVNPGFGGQAFIPASAERIRAIKDMARAIGASPKIGVDGGIDVHTAPVVADAGASILIAGSAIFCADDPAEALAQIKTAALTKLV